jgi:flagella basal body P-ring formation protein FlgA
MRALLGLALLWPAEALADAVIIVRTIVAGQVIAAADVTTVPDDLEAAVSTPAAAIGLAAAGTLYPGDVLRPSDLVAPVAIRRNAVITLVFQGGGLTIATQGRALDDGVSGAAIRVMNLSSRAIVTGTVRDTDHVDIGGLP